MIIVPPSVTIEHMASGAEILERLEAAGRTCYKSECRIGPGTARTFVKTLLDRQHESVIEHESATVRFVCDRGVSHELVRHRIASYSQESTRYCDYGKAGEIQVIEPPDLTPEQRAVWVHAMEAAQWAYNSLREHGAKPQIARAVLPTCLKTEVVVTMNLRSWRHFFKMRCARSAHPQIRSLATDLLREMHSRVPEIFQDLWLGATLQAE